MLGQQKRPAFHLERKVISDTADQVVAVPRRFIERQWLLVRGRRPLPRVVTIGEFHRVRITGEAKEGGKKTIQVQVKRLFELGANLRRENAGRKVVVRTFQFVETLQASKQVKGSTPRLDVFPRVHPVGQLRWQGSLPLARRSG